MANIKRVLVGAENFGSPLLSKSPIKKGDIVTVSKEVAANLDSHVWYDSANNDHPVFVETSDKLAAPYMGKETTSPRKKNPTVEPVEKKTTRRKKGT